MKLTGLAPVMMLSRMPKIISPGIRRFLGLFEALQRIGCIAHCGCHSERASV
jgi:hypothetical protein